MDPGEVGCVHITVRQDVANAATERVDQRSRSWAVPGPILVQFIVLGELFCEGVEMPGPIG